MTAHDIIVDERPYLLQWADDTVKTYNSFNIFLMGTSQYEAPPFAPEHLLKMLAEGTRSMDSAKMIMAHLPEDKQMAIWKNSLPSEKSCILQCLSGHAGIRQHIASFVGLVTSEQVCLLRKLAVSLRKYLEERPYQNVDLSDGGSSGSDESSDSDNSSDSGDEFNFDEH